jgi:shikimate kinase
MWITLVGFNGAGKSTLARRLAPAVDARPVDLDRAVTAASGRPVPEIFAAGGPPAFRELEGQVLDALRPDEPLVVATGGGTIERRATVDLLRQRGLVVWLDAPWPVIRRRLAPAPGEPASPVWQHLGEETLAALYARRRPLFAAAAQVRLDSGQFAPAVLVRRLLAHVPPRGAGV